MTTTSRSLVWPVFQLLMAVLIAAAVVAQLVASVTQSAEAGRDVATVVANYFSFFTILSNTLAAIVLAWTGVSGIRHGGITPSPAREICLAAVTTFMLITGIVYNALLRQIELPQGSQPIPWSNEILHLIGPLFFLVHVIFAPHGRPLPWRAVAVIIAFPLAWAAYTLVRGPLVTNPITGEPHWYPYPFLNPYGAGGWASVIVYVVIIAVAFLVVATAVVALSRRR